MVLAPSFAEYEDAFMQSHAKYFIMNYGQRTDSD